MPKALQHEFPQWQDDPHAEDSNGESREVWQGAMRVVSAKRARRLRKRGVPLMPLHAVYLNPCDVERGQSRAPLTPGNGPGKRSARYAWFECKDDAEARRWRRAANCYETWREAEQGLRGRKHELQERLESQRADHAARAYFRQGGKLAATTYYQTFERHGLYAGVIYANVLNPQLDLYAAAFRSMSETERVATEWGTPDGWGVDEVDSFGSEPANAGVPTHYEPNDYTRALLRDATPEQLDAAARVDMRDYYAALENPLQRATRETMLQAERDGLVQRADGGIDEVDPFGRVTPSYAGAPHLDCDCMACRPYTG